MRYTVSRESTRRSKCDIISSCKKGPDPNTKRSIFTEEVTRHRCYREQVYYC